LKERGFEMLLRGKMTTAADAYAKLMVSINNVYNDVMKTGSIDPINHSEEFKLFDNPNRVVDGPW
jgi:hypothetical protein